MQPSSLPSSLDPSIAVSTFDSPVINLDGEEEEEKQSQPPIISLLGKRKKRPDPKTYQEMFKPLVSSIKKMHDGEFHVKVTLVGEKFHEE